MPGCPTPQRWNLPFVTAASCLGDRGALVPVCFRNSARIPSPREPLGEESGLAPAGLRGERGAQVGHGRGHQPCARSLGKTSQQMPASFPGCPASYRCPWGCTPHRVMGATGEHWVALTLSLVLVWLNRTPPASRAKPGAAGTSGAAPSREALALLHHFKIEANKALGGSRRPPPLGPYLTFR